MPAPKRCLYLHGFASSPDSAKGLAVAAHLGQRARPIAVERLNLRQPSFEHLRGTAMIHHVETAMAGDDAVLIGSSLGGWVAMRVAERNPCVKQLILLAPAIGLAAGWKRRLPTSVARWRQTGWLAVEDHALGGMGRVDIGFLDDMDGLDADGPPVVGVPTLILHGRRDDVVPIAGSYAWQAEQWRAGRDHVELVEVDDDHQLTASLATVLAEIDRVLPG